jgi:predicted permease
MQAVKGALNAAGNCSIPLTLVVLGAYFYEPPRNPAVRAEGPVNGIATRNSSSSLILNVKRLLNGGATRTSVSERPGETKTVVVAVLSRMVITPLLLLPVIALLTVLNVQPVFEE